MLKHLLYASELAEHSSWSAIVTIIMICPFMLLVVVNVTFCLLHASTVRRVGARSV